MLIELDKNVKFNKETNIQIPWIGNYVGNTNKIREEILTSIRLDSLQHSLTLKYSSGTTGTISCKKISDNKLIFTGKEICFDKGDKILFFEKDVWFISRAILFAYEPCIMTIESLNFELKKESLYELRFAKIDYYTFLDHYEYHDDYN